MNSYTPVVLSLLIGCTVGLAAPTADWPQWRGPRDNGTSTSSGLPRTVDAAKLLWKSPLPGKACSTPIVWQQRIYLTAPVDGKDAVLAFDWNGSELWRTSFAAEVKGKHRNGSGGNPSPATDGSGVFVTFKSGAFAAVNLDGSIRWQMNLVERFGSVKLFWDYGNSPALTAKNVVIARMHAGDSWLAAFDKATGDLRWKTARNYETPNEVDNSYTTPLVIQYEGREALLTWGAQHVTVHDAADGKLLLSCGDFNPTATPQWPAVASPVVAGDVAVICFGRADRGVPRLHGIKLTGNGDVTATNRLWMREDVGAFVPTPAQYKGRIYVLSDRGQLDCLDPQTGKTEWKEVLPRTSSNFYGSPLIANGILYAIREDGSMLVASIEGGFKLLAQTKFADRVIASIVPAADRLFIRGETHLYCVGDR